MVSLELIRICTNGRLGSVSACTWHFFFSKALLCSALCEATQCIILVLLARSSGQKRLAKVIH